MADRPDLYTALTPNQCVECLQAAVDPSLALFGDKPVLGSIGPNAASLRRRIPYRNSFQTEVEVLIDPEGEGTRLVCSTDLPGFVVVGLIVSLGLLSLFAVQGGLPMLLASLGLMGFFAMIFAIGRSLARDEETFLMDFLRRTLDAHDIPPRRLSRPPPQT